MAANMHVYSLLACVVWSNLLGALWWSPLAFEGLWRRASALCGEGPKEGDPAGHGPRAYATGWLAAFGQYVVIANTLHTWTRSKGLQQLDLCETATIGAIIGVVVAVAVSTNYAFGHRGWTLFLIEQGHTLVNMIGMSLICGVVAYSDWISA